MNSKALLFSLVLVAVCLVGCDGGQAPSPVAVKTTAENIMYSRDSRSGLCFGVVTSHTSAGWMVVSITNVPCEAVEKLLVK